MPYSHSRAKGFTLVEMIIAASIICIMAGLSIVSFSGFLKRESLSANSSALANGIREARTRTLASMQGKQYGVKIDADRFTIFAGDVFSTSTADNSYMFAAGVRSSASMPVVVFSRVTGNASASGTIDLYLVGDPAVKKTVGVQGTGLVNIF